MRKIIYRADGGGETGMGHIVRGMTLASALSDEETEFIFVTRDIDDVPQLLRSKGFQVRPFEPNSTPTKVAGMISAHCPSLVINDIKDTPVEYMWALRNNGAPVMSLDDTGQGASMADALIDANVSEDTLYICHGGPRRFYGPRYMILGSDFSALHDETKAMPPEVGNVMIIMGGSDPSNSTEKIIKALDAVNPDFGVTAVAGFGFRRTDALRKLAEERNWLNVSECPASVSDIMFQADVAFCSGGITMFELACLGTPCIVLCQNPDEVSNTGLFVEEGAIESLGLAGDIAAHEITQCFLTVSGSQEKRRSMSDQGKELIDGKGLERILRVVDECMMQYSL